MTTLNTEVLQQADEALDRDAKAKRKRRLLGLAGAVLTLGTGYGAYDHFYASHFISTDNAYTAAETAQVTPAATPRPIRGVPQPSQRPSSAKDITLRAGRPWPGRQSPRPGKEPPRGAARLHARLHALGWPTRRTQSGARLHARQRAPAWGGADIASIVCALSEVVSCAILSWRAIMTAPWRCTAASMNRR